MALAGCGAGHRPATAGARAGGAVPPTAAPVAPSTVAPSTTAAAPAVSVSDPPGAVPAKPGSPSLAPAPAAHLSLSASSGPARTVVSLSVAGCPPPAGGYVAFFADSQALGDPQTPGYRHPFTVAATGPTTAAGTYRLGAGDTAGFGMFEVVCGSATNAIAPFTVSGG
jgi:hypothetical protein